MQGEGYCDAPRDPPKRWSMPAPAPNELHVYQPEPEPGVLCAPDSGAQQRKSKTYTQPALCNFVAKRMKVYADAHETRVDDDGLNRMNSHLLERVKQKNPAVKGIGILNRNISMDHRVKAWKQKAQDSNLQILA